MSEASSLLLVGAGTGGPARRIAEEFGVWVTGYEENLHLAKIANDRNRRVGLGRSARIECWDSDAPRFPRRYFHHAVAMEALRGARPELLLTALSRALKPGGQLVLVELVSDRTLDPADPIIAAWARLDHRPAALPNELMITALLRCLGFDVRIVEDVSRRNMRNVVAGWRAAVQSMSSVRHTPRRLAVVVREAELWLTRFRLMRRGTLRLVRWHAITAGAPSG